MNKKSLLLIFLVIQYFTSFGNEWIKRNSNEFRIDNRVQIRPDEYEIYTTEYSSLVQKLKGAPHERNVKVWNSNFTTEIPTPYGLKQFKVIETDFADDILMRKYPDIKTYIIQSIENPSFHGRIDFTYKGFHAMIIYNNKTFFIDPLYQDDNSIYQVYLKENFKNKSGDFICETSDEESTSIINQSNIAATTNGEELRTYRLALACTGEYAQFHGGTIPSVLSAMVTSINRVNMVYEYEFAIRMILIPNNDTLIFLDGATDPYTNNSGSQMLGQNQTTVNSRIGSANYDIGHVYSTGGGGIAQLGCVCSNSNKARGVTGSSSPVGDPFDIDYVAHEMGHQFDSNHTFQSILGSCNGNRRAASAFEPGSGVTVMAYAGLCSTDNLASNSIAYFHAGSFKEVLNFITFDNGNNCGAVSSTGNNPPEIKYFRKNYSIPFNTPFELNAEATDPDGDSVVYSWEQIDQVQTGGAWNNPVGDAPIWRSYNPVTSGYRMFPRLQNIINNYSATIGESLPTYARTMRFHLTVRDMKPQGGGIIFNDTMLTINVLNTGTPFRITSQAESVNQWPATSLQTITWDVASTNTTPINTQYVRIFLSQSGYSNFNILLADSVVNDGSHEIMIPLIPTTNGRIKIQAIDNVFFDINKTPIVITGTASIEDLQHNNCIVYPNPVSDFFSINCNSQIVKSQIFDSLGRLVSEVNEQNSVQQIDVSHLQPGSYFIMNYNQNGELTGREKILKM